MLEWADIVIAPLAALVGVAFGAGGTVFAENRRAKSEFKKQEATQRYELRQSLRSDLLSEIIGLIENEFTSARELASRMQSAGAQSAHARSRMAAAENELAKAKVVKYNESDVEKYRMKVARLEESVNQLDAEMNARFEDLQEATSNLKSKALRIKLLAPDAVVRSINEMEAQFKLVLQTTQDSSGVVYRQETVKSILLLDTARDELATEVQKWVHQ